MILKGLISTFIATIFSLILIFNSKAILTKLQNQTNEINPYQVESEITDLKLSQFQSDKNTFSNSNKKYDLIGKHATIYTNGISKIQSVNLIVYQNKSNQLLWQINADLANHDKNSNRTHLSGNVIAINPIEKIKLETESLWIEHENQIIHSNTEIDYQMPNQRVSASGIKIDYYHKMLGFSPNVESLIELTHQ